MGFYFAVSHILFVAVSILNYLPLHFSSKMASTMFKIYRVPGISIQSCAKTAAILLNVSKYSMVAKGLH